MTWLGLGVPIQTPTQQLAPSGGSGGGSGGSGANSAPVAQTVTLRFDIVAESGT